MFFAVYQGHFIMNRLFLYVTNTQVKQKKNQKTTKKKFYRINFWFEI